MNARRIVAAAVVLLLAGCARGPAHVPAHAAPPVTFVNRVWAVADSSSMPSGALYVFLADGTLAISSPHGTPSFGAWKREAGGLTVIEEGRPYPADILRLDAEAFWLRLHDPGEGVLLRFVPADTARAASARPDTGAAGR